MAMNESDYVKVYVASIGGSGEKGERLRDATLSDAERQFSMWTHLSIPIGVLLPMSFAWLVAPLVLWLLRKDASPFNDDHGRQAINFILSFFVLHLLTALTIIGVLLWPVIWIVSIVSLIRASVAAHHGEYFRYPLTMRFLG
ncbi:MAG: DUF4870 domain-containing protein [Phycisphaerales bacterium]|nr:DUF4870 domain-containing protein [Phycisphaerales bacterium]